MYKNKSGKTTITWIAQNPFIIFFDILAVMVSWFYNHSIFWAIIHYIFGPAYLIYSILIGRFANGGFMNIIHNYF